MTEVHYDRAEHELGGYHRRYRRIEKCMTVFRHRYEQHTGVLKYSMRWIGSNQRSGIYLGTILVTGRNRSAGDFWLEELVPWGSLA